MFKSFIKFFAAPVFPDDEDKTRKASYAHWIASAFAIVPTLYELYLWQINKQLQFFSAINVIILALAVAGMVSWRLVRKGRVSFASIVLVSLIWIGVNTIAASGYGIHDSSFIVNFVIMLITALLLGRWAAILIAIASVLVGIGLANREAAGFLVPPAYPVTFFAGDLSVVFALAAASLYMLVDSLEKAIKQSRKSLLELKTANADLQHAQTDLHARSAELLETNEILQKRTERLRAVAEVARTATAVQDFDQLLPLITNVVSRQLGYYHVGIFLLDEANEYAVLRAANSEGGQVMLNRGHKLSLSDSSIVGYVTSHGEPRKSQDVGTDAVFFNNPDLPNTRSEMALPLRSGNRVIGALDVQSDQRNAFIDEDIATLTILSDQVAIAIENARLFASARAALNESERSFEQYVKQQWRTFAAQTKATGYTFDGTRTVQSPPKGQHEKPKNLAQTGRLSLEKERQEVTVPIRFRGQTVGYLEVKSKKGSRQWTRDELTLLEAAAERAALALENARLVESARRRASRERAIGEISSKIGSIQDKETIMRTTVEELARRLGGTMEVSLELDIETNAALEENLE